MKLLSRPKPEKSQEHKTTSASITKVYWPLALSWFFMAWEGQLAMWLIGLMPDNKIYQAGFLIVFGIAIFIESPVIDLLSTGTTLGTTKKRFEQITRFTLILMTWVTVAHCIVVFTPPIYTFVAETLLGARPEVATAAWYGLAWMPVWSACVGWRRYRQGIMIRAGRTGPISWGTLVRIVAMMISGLALYVSGTMIGLGVIGLSFTIAVFAEALYIHIVSKPVIAELTETDPTNIDNLTLSQLAKFHFPLTASTMLMLTAPVLMTRALNEGPEPIIAMAAWQVSSTVVWLFRTITFALPEAVIALYKPGRERYLGSFCIKVGGGITLTMLAVHAFQFDLYVFRAIFKSEPLVADRAATAFLWCSFLPLLNALMAYYRGVLTSHHITSARLYAIIIALAALAITLTLGLRIGILTVVLAAAALTLSHLVELATLAIAWHRSRHLASPTT
ncbi:hypothetical protein C0431_11785 [bacterium]|nr:hypothetical protein [bacterium]